MKIKIFAKTKIPDLPVLFILENYDGELLR